jgi:hypothetical protein
MIRRTRTYEVYVNGKLHMTAPREKAAQAADLAMKAGDSVWLVRKGGLFR